jgi:hemoglobin-like flavoprotein
VARSRQSAAPASTFVQCDIRDRASTMAPPANQAARTTVTPTEKELIRSTWAAVVPIQAAASDLFYERLFELDPKLASLFAATDMQRQGRMLMQTLSIVVKSLDDLSVVIPAVEALGRRHVAYGVQSEDYETVGGALLWTLEQGLGDAFTPEARAAWAGAYGIVSSVMVAAAEQVEIEAPAA